jgi:formate-dependent nitrite reductase membrane component NrfD
VYIGKDVPFSSQSKMYEALRQTSILIFGLIGAWLAVLLPFSVEKDERLNTFFSFSKEIFPALSSAIYLLIITLAVPFLAEIVKNIYKFDNTSISLLRSASMGVICLSTFMLIAGLINILISFDLLKKDISLTKAENEKEIKLSPKSKQKKE